MELIFLLLPLLGLGFLVGGDGAPTPATEGTEGEDTIYGTDGDDVVLAGAGNDFVNTYQGNDEIHYGDGDDAGTGSDGNDTLFGGAGNDGIVGGAGDDIVWLGEGDDASYDFVDQGDLEQGDDEIHGEGGADWIGDLQGSDRLFGDSGNDTLVALDSPDLDFAPDQLFGGTDDDLLVGDDADTLSGGEGLDSFIVHLDGPNDNPVTITDFDAALETITLELHDPSGAPVIDRASLAFTTDDATGDVTLVYDGQVVAQLTAPGVFNLDSVQIQAVA